MIFLAASFPFQIWVGIVFLASVVLCLAPSTIRDVYAARTWREALDSSHKVLVVLGALSVLLWLQFLLDEAP